MYKNMHNINDEDKSTYLRLLEAAERNNIELADVIVRRHDERSFVAEFKEWAIKTISRVIYGD